MQESLALIFIITTLRYFLIRLKDMSSNKLYFIILWVTVAVIYISWSEFYQFFYTLNHYNSLDWVYDDEAFT